MRNKGMDNAKCAAIRVWVMRNKGMGNAKYAAIRVWIMRDNGADGARCSSDPKHAELAMMLESCPGKTRH
jgi:hypothetical protein